MSEDDEPGKLGLRDVDLTPEMRARLDRLLGDWRLSSRNVPILPINKIDEPPQAPEVRLQQFKDSLGLMYEATIKNERERLFNLATDQVAKQTALGLSESKLLESVLARLDRLLNCGDDDPDRQVHGRRPAKIRNEYWTDTNGDRYVNVKGRARLIGHGL